MKTNLRLALAALLVTAAGCTTFHPTPAPTLHAKGASLEQVKNAVVRVYAVDGWKLDKDVGQQLIFLKEVNDRAAQSWYGASPSNPVFARETLTFAQTGDSITARPAQEIVIYRDTPAERCDPVTTYEFTSDRFAEIESSLCTKAPADDKSFANFALGK